MAIPKLLMVEDDEGIQLQLKYALRKDFALTVAGDRTQALAAARASTPELVLLDLGLPPSPDGPTEGLQALDQLLALTPRPKVIVLTGQTDRELALQCIEAGAFDYHQKPVDIDALRAMLRRAAYLHGVERDSEEWVREREQTIRFEHILGSTPSMRNIFTVIQRVARTDATVLIEGESGTGKELIARAIHQRSRRREAPFIAINCGAIPETTRRARSPAPTSSARGSWRSPTRARSSSTRSAS
jgi:two-component system NtrC family response regulator